MQTKTFIMYAINHLTAPIDLYIYTHNKYIL